MHALKKSTTWALSCFFLTVILITTNAGIVKAFQRQPISGIVIADAKTDAKSDEKVKPLKEGDSNDDVVTLQKNLRELRLYIAPTTGYYGPTTTKAVKDFQKKHQLSQNGVADAMTQTAIGNALDALCREGLGGCYYGPMSYEEPEGLEINKPEIKPEITSDGMILNVAQKLSLGQSEEVNFKIPHSALKEKLEDFNEYLDRSVGKKRRLTRIKVKLSSSQSENFEINPKGADEQFVVEKGKPALWQWNIKPQKIGEKDLSTQVFLIFKDPYRSDKEVEQSLDLGLISSKVQVEANLFQRLELFVQQLDLFVKAILVVFAGAVAAALASLKVIRDAFAPLNPFKKITATTQSVDVGGKKPDDENN